MSDVPAPIDAVVSRYLEGTASEAERLVVEADPELVAEVERLFEAQDALELRPTFAAAVLPDRLSAPPQSRLRWISWVAAAAVFIVALGLYTRPPAQLEALVAPMDERMWSFATKYERGAVMSAAALLLRVSSTEQGCADWTLEIGCEIGQNLALVDLLTRVSVLQDVGAPDALEFSEGLFRLQDPDRLLPLAATLVEQCASGHPLCPGGRG